MYYNRLQPASSAIKFSVESDKKPTTKIQNNNDHDGGHVKKEDDVCTLQEGCISCGS
jgi:hypothetical protein